MTSTHKRCWQADARLPGGGRTLFGVTARSREAAEAKAAELYPQADLTVTRIYWRGMRTPPQRQEK